MKQEIEESGDRVPMVSCWTRADRTRTLRVCYRSGPQELVMLLVTGCHIQLPTSATHTKVPRDCTVGVADGPG
jgi:hypothetical protein